jgi:hypothetical protein
LYITTISSPYIPSVVLYGWYKEGIRRLYGGSGEGAEKVQGMSRLG